MSLPHRSQIKAKLIELLTQYPELPVSEVHERLRILFELTDADTSLKRGGQLLYKNEIRWARQELVGEGVIAKPSESSRGIWKLVSVEFTKPASAPSELSSNSGYPEGAVTQILVNKYERNSSAREACLAHYGYTCSVCEFDFENEYGPLGAGIIHVHHLTPVSQIRTGYQVDPIQDLRPVCPNCHQMIHRRVPSFEIHEIKAMRASANTHCSTSA